MKVSPKLRGELHRHFLMAPLTSWRVGGRADRLYLPADRNDLIRFLAALPDHEPLFWLGLGSNLLIRDGGLRGTVVATPRRLAAIGWQGDLLYVEAGVAAPFLARYCARKGWGGVEFLAGIPGTIGGALAMNAGAFGEEIWERVVWVETVDRSGKVRRRTPEAFRVGYRRVEGPVEEWFLGCGLKLERRRDAAERIRKLLVERSRRQPKGASCGSVFKNPGSISAGWLIERCGLKGLRVGRAVVSEKHANFIINSGGALAREIETLIETVQQRVFAQTGIWLEPEVRILGER